MKHYSEIKIFDGKEWFDFNSLQIARTTLHAWSVNHDCYLVYFDPWEKKHIKEKYEGAELQRVGEWA